MIPRELHSPEARTMADEKVLTPEEQKAADELRRAAETRLDDAGGDAGGDDRFQFPGQDLVEVEVLPEPVVRAPTVFPVVGPDLFRSTTGADLHEPLLLDLGGLFLLLELEEFGAQQLHRQLLVLELRPFLRTEDANPRRMVHEVAGRFYLVHILAARAAASSRRHADVLGINLNLHVVDLGHDC